MHVDLGEQTPVVSQSELHGGGRAGIHDFDWRQHRLLEGVPEDRLASRVEQIRQELMGTNDVGRVGNTLKDLGVDIDSQTLREVKNYNFDSRGLEFTAENYDAWKRLANGVGTVDDARYMVHEASELKALREIQRNTGFDFMGRSSGEMSGRESRQWTADFDRNYRAAHSQALMDEYRYISDTVDRITNGQVRMSPVVAAAIDPVRDEALFYMQVDGVPLGEHSQFDSWHEQGQNTVTLSRATADRLRLPRGHQISTADLIRRIKRLRADY